MSGASSATAKSTSRKRWGPSRSPSRENLDNLIFVINCNLQRLDGPVRGNGKIIQELEGIFRGAGWNVIKVIWGDDWDELLEKDKSGLLVKRMGEVVDGEYQKYTVMPGSYIREHFFGKYPELLELVSHLSDEEAEEAHAAAATIRKRFMPPTRRPSNAKGGRRVILAKTIKGYGLGEIGEGRNATHSAKEAERRRAARIPLAVRHSDFRRRSGQGPLLRPGRGHAGNEISARAPQDAGWLCARPA